MGSRRIWEIDFLRVMAIILMVIFHTVFDLNRFVGMGINYLSGFWYWEGKTSALIFIFLAGISSGFSKNSISRGSKVLAYGMMITLVTYIFFREQYVRFGILHLLGISMILFPLFKKMNNMLLFISSAVIALTAIPLKNTMVKTSLLLPFGAVYKEFATVDYYPLSPYLSMFLLGVLAYKMYYYKKQSLYEFSYENKYISAISKNSLAIYLIHQPIIISAIFLFKFLTRSS